MPSLPDRLAADLLVARVGPGALVGIVEHEPLVLTTDDHLHIARDQIALRVAAAQEYDEMGRADAAVTVRTEIAVLERYLPTG